MALTPEEQKELDYLTAQENAHDAPTGAGGTGNAPAPPLEDMLDPQFDLVPQGLAVQPATTHPGGDEAAEAAWKRNPVEASKGNIYFYEPPLAAVQKRLSEDPAFASLVAPSLPMDPNRIASLTNDDSNVQAARDQLWREGADAAAKSGKTAIRYSKAPWLHGGGAMETLRNLGMKGIGAVGPALDTVNSFVMGVDKTALLTAGRAVDETISGGDPKVVPGIEQAGIPQENAKQYNERTIEDHPVANMVGQALPLLKGWGAASALYRAATGLTGKAAAAAGGGLTARVLAGGAGAALGGGAVQAGQDAVQAGGNIAQTGSPGITGGEIASRAGQAAADPMNAGFGAAGEVLGSLAGRGAEQFREGPRYGGAPGRFERLGGKFEMGKGPVAPEPVQANLNEALTLDAAKVDPIAERLAPVISKGQKEAVNEITRHVEQINEPIYASREGKMELPVTELETKTLEQLRHGHKFDERRGHLVPLNGKGSVDYTRQVFNRNIEAVSLKKIDGAIEMTPDEAQAFLNGMHKNDLLENLTPSKPPPPAGGAAPVAPAPPDPAATATGAEAPTVPPKGKAAKAAGAAPPAGTPKTADTVRMDSGGHETLQPLALYGKAQKADNARAAALKSELLPELPQWKPNSGKTYISDLYEQAKGKFKTREEFNKALMDAHKGSKGGILQRIDLTETADPAKLKASRVKAVNGEYDLVDSSKASDLLKQWGLAGAGAAATAAASDDKEGSVAAGAGAIGLAMLLKKKGIEKVYVLPKRMTAREHETVIKGVQDLKDNPSTPEQRQAAAIYHAALRDRDQRPLNGVPGAWSKHQNENSRQIEEVKRRAELAAPGGDAFPALVQYGEQSPGQLPAMRAMQHAAERAGVRPQLDQLRMLGPLASLKNEMATGHAGTGRGLPQTAWGAVGRFGDAGMMRFGYPALQSLGGPMSPIRGGMAGRAGSIKREEKEKKDKTP